MLDLLTNATSYLLVALLYASCFFWCFCLQVVGGLYDFAVWRTYPFLCLLQDQVENFVLPPEECSPTTEMAASGDQISCLDSYAQFPTYCRSDYTVPPDFLSGNKVHWLQRTCYKEPAWEEVYVPYSHTTGGVRKEAGSYSAGIAPVDQVANELEDPMDIDEVDPRYDTMEVDPWNWNLGWAHGNEQFNFEFALPRTNFESSGVVFEGASGVVVQENEVNNVFNDRNTVEDGARNVPVNAPALVTPRVLLDPPQMAAPAALEDDLGQEIEDILAEILGDSDSD